MPPATASSAFGPLYRSRTNTQLQKLNPNPRSSRTHQPNAVLPIISSPTFPRRSSFPSTALTTNPWSTLTDVKLHLQKPTALHSLRSGNLIAGFSRSTPILLTQGLYITADRRNTNIITAYADQSSPFTRR